MHRMGTGRSRGTGAGLCWTVLVHGGALALAVGFVHPPPPTPPVYAIDLVAAPAPAPRQRLAPEAQPPAPSPEPPAPFKPAPKPEEKTAPVKKPEPRPVERPKPTPPRETPPEAKPSAEPSPRTSAPETPAEGETPSTGRDAATVKTPGLDFPFPEYLRNVANQIYRRWRRPTGNVRLRAEIFFLIHRDGTVSDIRFVTRSGSFSYDLEAQGAVEAAGVARAFGPLPDGWTNDVLPISFFFEPRSE